jgi:hypothetical protein
MELLLHPEAQEEWRQLPVSEYRAMANALAKLQELGDRLAFPHTSNIEGQRTYASFVPAQAAAAVEPSSAVSVTA